MHIHDMAAVARLLLGGDIGAGEAYVDGLWSSPDLPALFRLAALNREALALSERLVAPSACGSSGRLAHRARRNTVGQSRRNIAAHYDLGNDFYRLFLDETMTYSSAVFATPDQSLADAQRTKYAVMAERAGLRGGEHVLEIGTGWGGFALYAAGELGCRVTTITISSAQHALATERVRSRRPRGPRQRRAARLPRHPGHVRRDRLDRDAGGRGGGVLQRLLRGVRPGARGRVAG